jgi:hypothetical protein
MSVKPVIFSLFLAAAVLINGPASAAEPTIDQVYGLPFAKAQAVQELQHRIGASSDSSAAPGAIAWRTATCVG